MNPISEIGARFFLKLNDLPSFVKILSDKVCLFAGQQLVQLLPIRPAGRMEVLRSSREELPRYQPLPQCCPRSRRYASNVEVCKLMLSKLLFIFLD
jgi:hypothetical protein